MTTAAASPTPPRIISTGVTPRLIVIAPLILPILFHSPFASAEEEEPQPIVEEYICEIPTAGCKNGMFNLITCQCDCIPPYCRYEYDGTCTALMSDDPMCGQNPWADCTRGVNCPWWINPMKDENCVTGPDLPAEMWDLYNTKKACCAFNFPYSTICNRKLGTDSPTKHPTISTPDEGFEVIPIKFDLRGVPDDVSMRSLKNEMLTVLKRLISKLAERIPDLRVTSIEEKVIMNNGNSRRLGKRIRRQRHRGLAQDVALYWNVNAIRTDGVKFGPIIIQELRENYDEIVEQIQAFADTSFFGAMVSLNLCTSVNGRFSDCIFDTVPPTRAPTTAKPMTPVSFDIYDEGPGAGGGIPAWSISIIVLGSLLFVGGLVGFLTFMGWCAFCWCACCCCASPCDRFGKKSEKNEIHNTIHVGENQDGNDDDSYFAKKSCYTRRSTKSIQSANPQHYDEDDEFMLALPPPEEENSNPMLALPPPPQPQSQYGKQSIDARTLATSVVPRGKGTLKSSRRSSVAARRSKKKKKSKKKSKSDKKSTGDPSNSKTPRRRGPLVYTVHSTQNSALIQNNGGRDPTVYVPGNEMKPDPSIFMLESESEAGYYNKYAEEPCITPKRDPSAYITDGSKSYYSHSTESNYSRLPRRMSRDPTMYVDGRSSNGSGVTMDYSHRSESNLSRPQRRMSRDPTMYVDGRNSNGSGASAMYSSQSSHKIAESDLQPPDPWRKDEGQEDSNSFWTRPPAHPASNPSLPGHLTF